MGNASLRRLSALESAAINNTMLIQIAVLAWVFLGEAPGLTASIGVGVVSCGAFLAHGFRLAPRAASGARRSATLRNSRNSVPPAA